MGNADMTQNVVAMDQYRPAPLSAAKDLYEVGEIPPVGPCPCGMAAGGLALTNICF